MKSMRNLDVNVNFRCVLVLFADDAKKSNHSKLYSVPYG